MTTTNLIISDNDPIISIYCGTTISEKKRKKKENVGSDILALILLLVI